MCSEYSGFLVLLFCFSPILFFLTLRIIEGGDEENIIHDYYR